MFGNNFSKIVFGNRLAERRKECGYKNQTELAAKILTPGDNGDDYARRIESKRKAISNWENGRSEPSVSDFAAICEALECDPEYLLGTIETPLKETRTAAEITGLSDEAVFRLQREHGKNQLVALNKLLLQDDFWKILNSFTNFGEEFGRLAEENKKQSELYWEIVKAGLDPDDDDIDEEKIKTYRRVAIALDKRRYEYDLERYYCQILFKSIVDKFLPNRW